MTIAPGIALGSLAVALTIALTTTTVVNLVDFGNKTTVSLS